MKTLIGMNRGDLEVLEASDVDWLITPDELLYTAGVFEAFWQYNGDAAKEGRKGLHAELKSGLHSDGFFAAKILLSFGNMMNIMAHQLVGRLTREPAFHLPGIIFGVPTSATLLAQEVGRILQVPVGMMEKRGEEGMVVRSPVREFSSNPVLVVEDLCTRGTGFGMAVEAIRRHRPTAEILPFDPVILNRGPCANLWFGKRNFKVVAVGSRLMNDWPANECPLCADGSEAIKPKAEPGNWELLVNSQK
jgi:orotate phosphoribosyltransferase